MFRPEMVIWAVVMGVGRGLLEARESANDKAAPRNVVGRTTLHAVVAAAPFLGMCVLRVVLFGSVAPLALRAKPSDLQHGLVYAAATLLIAGPPLAVIAPRGWLALAPWPRVILAAFAAHTLTVVAVGGDWMPMSRSCSPTWRPRRDGLRRSSEARSARQGRGGYGFEWASTPGGWEPIARS